jgi:hypothetical protein
MTRLRRVACFLLAAAALPLAWASRIQAAPENLSDLLGGGVFHSGDLVFSNFQYSPMGRMTPVQLLVVTEEVDEHGAAGIRISQPLFSLIDGESADGVISFVVSTDGPPIIGAHLSGLPRVNDEKATGISQAIEEINGGALPALEIFARRDQGSLVERFDDGEPLPPVNLLEVTTRIHGVVSGGDTVSASLQYVDEFFAIGPEPSGLILFVLGALGVMGGGLRGRRGADRVEGKAGKN